MAMMAMTTKSSISVNPRFVFITAEDSLKSLLPAPGRLRKIGGALR
jgi:hypothetical protein